MNRKQAQGRVVSVMGRICRQGWAEFAGRTGRWLRQVGAATAMLACVGVFADPGWPVGETTRLETSLDR